MLRFSTNTALTLDGFINDYLSCTAPANKDGEEKGIIPVLSDALWSFLSEPEKRQQFKKFLSDATHPKRKEFICAHHYLIAILTFSRDDMNLFIRVSNVLNSEFGMDTSQVFENNIRPYYDYDSILQMRAKYRELKAEDNMFNAAYSDDEDLHALEDNEMDDQSEDNDFDSFTHFERIQFDRDALRRALAPSPSDRVFLRLAPAASLNHDSDTRSDNEEDESPRDKKHHFFS
jgi:hypothetical protein